MLFTLLVMHTTVREERLLKKDWYYQDDVGVTTLLFAPSFSMTDPTPHTLQSAKSARARGGAIGIQWPRPCQTGRSGMWDCGWGKTDYDGYIFFWPYKRFDIDPPPIPPGPEAPLAPPASLYA